MIKISFSACTDDEQSKGKLRFVSDLPCNFVGNNRCVKTRIRFIRYVNFTRTRAYQPNLLRYGNNMLALDGRSSLTKSTDRYILKVLIKGKIKINLNRKERAKNRETEKREEKKVLLSKRIVWTNDGARSKRWKHFIPLRYCITCY